MTITFENDTDVIVYALEKIIAYARDKQYIFLVQSVWWISSIIGLQQGLITYIDNLTDKWKAPLSNDWASVIPIPQGSNLEKDKGTSEEDKETQQDRVLKECKEFLRDSRRLCLLAKLRVTRRTKEGRINSLASSRKSQRIAKRKNTKYNSKLEGIEEAEIQRWREEGECLHCAWPTERKGHHRVKDCIRKIKLDSGTASGSRTFQLKYSSQGSTDSASDT